MGSEEAPEAAFAINRGESADQIISTLGLLYSGMQITERRPATVGGRAATSHVGTSQQPPYRGWITTLNARDGEGKITGFVAGSAPGSWPRWSPVFEKIMASIRIGPGAAAEAPPAGTAAGGTTVLATLANQASENVHIYVEGESCDPGNRLAPGESREVAVKMDSFGRVTFHAGRNGATIATKVWNGDPDSTNRVPRVIFTSYGTLIVLTSLK
jgi:hypothetical protein